MNDKRDPEAFLRIAEAQEQKKQQGQLKIYLGAAPGVGKTYQMLTDALNLRAQGMDVVIGCVVTHGRDEVESLASAFEKIPLKAQQLEHGVAHTLDLIAVEKRAPGLVLVDEAAFSNPKGLQHPKRWQDITELLEKGLNVYTTLNIQHLESLNDVVTSLVGIPIYETVPDAFLERADSIELIDLPSEELIKRLKQGKVYVPSEASIAINHFFKKKNLDALRELVLRIMAERVGSQVENPYSKTLSARLMYKQETLLVCIKNHPSMLKLIRAAKRLSLRLQCPWYAIFVDSGSKKDFFMVQQYLQMAEGLGAKTEIIFSRNFQEALEQFIGRNQITQVVLGQSKRRWWRPWSRLDLLLGHLQDVGVYHIELDDKPKKNQRWIHFFKSRWLAVVAMALLAVWGYFSHQLFTSWWTLWLFAVALLVFASIGEWIKVAVLTVLLIGLDLLLNDHSMQLLLNNTEDWLAHYGRWSFLFLIMSATLVYAKQKLDKAGELERNNGFLMGFYQTISSVRGSEAIIQAAFDYLSTRLQLVCMVFMKKDNQLCLLLPDIKNPLDTKEMAIVEWVYESGKPAGQGTGNLTSSEAYFLPLKGSEHCLGVMRFENLDGQTLSSFQKKNLWVCISQLANILDIEEQQKSRHLQGLSNLKNETTNLLLKGFAKQLYKPFSHLMDIIPEQLAFSPYSQLLERLRKHLKVMMCFSDNKILSQMTWQNMQDIIQQVLNRHSQDWGNWPVTWYVGDKLPKVKVQLELMEEVIENLLDNIKQHSNAEDGVEISIHRKQDGLLVSIADFGPGFSEVELKKLFDTFYQAHTPGASDGLGMGLALCERIIVWHGGRIWAENRKPRGAIFNFSLPLENEAMTGDNDGQ